MNLQIDIPLFIFGAMVGAIANWAICTLRFYGILPHSPWGPQHPDVSVRRATDYLPIFGWLTLRRDASVLGRGFWIRPLVVELGFACGAVWFYHWLAGGGLSGTPPREGDLEIWYSSLSLLFVLVTIASLIDLDEMTIPDWITIPGTLAALTFAIAAPNYRLPEQANAMVASYQAVNFLTPHSLNAAEWRYDWRGLGAGLGTIWVWAWALLPMTFDFRRGIGAGCRLLWASIIRPARRTRCAIRVRQRRPHAALYGMLLLAFVLSLIIGAVWFLKGDRWDSLLGALLGLAMGGGLTWGVRLIGSYAYGREAMGFGDVTLMAMIGAFLGWQAVLMAFVAAPFAALLIVGLQFLISGSNVLAFGPYLSLGAVLVVLGWRWLWPIAVENFFQLPHWITLSILFGCLAAIGPMLWTMSRLRGGELDEGNQ
jgi:leader peptidase (prepilin peptidase) / N-methyltransferase